MERPYFLNTAKLMLDLADNFAALSNREFTASVVLSIRVCILETFSFSIPTSLSFCDDSCASLISRMRDVMFTSATTNMHNVIMLITRIARSVNSMYCEYSTVAYILRH